MSGQRKQQPPAAKNDPTPEQVAKAIQAEAEIAAEAAKIRGEADADKGLTPELFMQLYPLLCKPIPEGFIQTIGTTTGKPYVSTGIRSVQVQIDRMNNVLTPLWWWDEVQYDDGGKLAVVTVRVGTPGNFVEGGREMPNILVERSSRGGVSQGSNAGNIYKGSYTNAAKLAFARLGPGHEVYLGAADLDPDVNQEVAEQAGKQKPNGKPAGDTDIGPGIASALVKRAWALPDGKEKLRLAASRAAGRDVGDCSTEKGAVEALAGLTYDQAELLDGRITRREAETKTGETKEGGDGE